MANMKRRLRRSQEVAATLSPPPPTPRKDVAQTFPPSSSYWHCSSKTAWLGAMLRVGGCVVLLSCVLVVLVMRYQQYEGNIYDVVVGLYDNFLSTFHTVESSVNTLWVLTLTLMTLYQLLVHLMPHDMTLLQSFSYSGILSWNFGREGLAFNVVALVTYHRSVVAMLTHLTVFSDLFAWYVILAALGPIFLGVVMLLQSAQLISYKSRKFSAITFFTYLPMAAFAYYLREYAFYGRIVVVLSCVARMLGHTSEPFPPPLSGSDKFVDKLKMPRMQLILKLPVAIAVGAIAEFSSGMPLRLFTSAYYVLLCTIFGSDFENSLPMRKCYEIDEAIQTHGWAGYPEVVEAMEKQSGLFWILSRPLISCSLLSLWVKLIGVLSSLAGLGLYFIPEQLTPLLWPEAEGFAHSPLSLLWLGTMGYKMITIGVLLTVLDTPKATFALVLMLTLGNIHFNAFPPPGGGSWSTAGSEMLCLAITLVLAANHFWRLGRRV